MKYALPCLLVLIVLAVVACSQVTAAGTEARATAPATGSPGLSGGGGKRAERRPGAGDPRTRQA